MSMTPSARRRLVILVVALGLPITVLGALTLFLLGDGPARRLAEAWAERFPGHLGVSGLRLAAADAVELQGLRLDDDAGRPVLVLDDVAMRGSWRTLGLHGARVRQGRVVVDAPALDFWRHLASRLDRPPLDLVLPHQVPEGRAAIQIDDLDLHGPDGRRARLSLRAEHDDAGRHWLIEGSGDYGSGEVLWRDRPGDRMPDHVRWTVRDLDSGLSRDLLRLVLGQELPAILDQSWPAWSSSGMISRDDDVTRLVLVATCDHPLLPQRIDLRGSLSPNQSLATTLHWGDNRSTGLRLSATAQGWRVELTEGQLPWAAVQAWATALGPPLGAQLRRLPLTPSLTLTGSWAEGAGRQWQGQLAMQAAVGIGVTVQIDSAWQLNDTSLAVSALHLDSPLLQLGPATGTWDGQVGTLHWPSWTLKRPGALWLRAATGLNPTGLSTLVPHGALRWTTADATLSITCHGRDEARWHMLGGLGPEHQRWSLHAQHLPVSLIADARFGPVSGALSELRGQWTPTGHHWAWEASLREVALSAAAGRYQVAQAQLQRSRDHSGHWRDAHLTAHWPPAGPDDPALTMDITDLAAVVTTVAETWQIPALRGRLHGTLSRRPDGSLRPRELQAETLGVGNWLNNATARLTAHPDDPDAVIITLSGGQLPLKEHSLALDNLRLRWQGQALSGRGRLAGGSPLRLEAQFQDGQWQVQALIDPLSAADLSALMPPRDLASGSTCSWPLAVQMSGTQGWHIALRPSLHRPLIPGLPWTMADFLEPQP